MAHTDRSAAELLGTPLPESEPLALVARLEAGLPYRSLNQFKRALNLADADIAQVLQMSGRTLTRLHATKPKLLPSDLSERLYSVAQIYALAEDVFADHTTALGWMSEPQFGLQGQRPSELVRSEIGRQQVRELLQRIEHGLAA
jgi:putative toxin-antitoxin system antitoxin component (TIGR02293 family)